MGRRRVNSGGRAPAAINATFVPEVDGGCAAKGFLLLWGPDRPERFPWHVALQRLGLPVEGLALPSASARLMLPKEGRFRIVSVSGVALRPAEAVKRLGAVRFDRGTQKGKPRRRYQATSALMAWSLAAKLALELVSRQAFVPSLQRDEDGGVIASWLAAVEASHDVGRVRRLSADMPTSAHALLMPTHRKGWDRRRQSRRRRKPPRVWHPERLVRAFLDAAVDDLVRDLAQDMQLPAAGDGWEGRWLRALLGEPRGARMDDGEAGPLESMAEEIQQWLSWVVGAGDRPSREVDSKAGLWLEMPDETLGEGDFWYLRYMLLAADDPSLAVPAQQVFATASSKLRIFDHTFDRPQEKLLAALGHAGRLFEPVRRSLEHPRPEGVFLDARQAWQFISEAGPVLYSAGFDVRLPGELTGQGQRRLRARMRIRDVRPGDFEESYVGMDDLAAFEWEAALGEESIDAESFRQIVALKQPLVKWRGQWVLVDPLQLKDIEQLLSENTSTGTMSRFEALSRALTGVADLGTADGRIEVVVEGKIAALLESLSGEDGVRREVVPTPEKFIGELRPYQERGLSWLVYQAALGLGACLADDMGLGKTIQVIAFLLHQQQLHPDERAGTLLICPTSVVGNWQRELARFAPSLPVVRFHGSDRPTTSAALNAQFKRPHTVLITTYGLAVRDEALLTKRRWSTFVLDEAQAIKNVASKRSQVVRDVEADFRVALTGTPIENRLSELWSILDFLNPGLLGTHERFRRLFELPIERYQDPGALDKLRRLVGPFILRRLKTDPTIIEDLPEKFEMKVYCTLTREQATLYQALVDQAMAGIEEAQGLTRHGRVLALLTHLKQVCNHPTLYLHDPEEQSTAKRSGKLTRIMEMLDEVVESGDRALVFTQFKQMGDLLVQQIQEAFDVEVPFLHGGVPQAQRDVLVDSFQAEDGPPIFVLSLKAGGTGLNLTAANHVFHFDRWWNPAVEDQATDRAFRIGQTRDVQVHKLVSLGTLEEKIDAMLTEKRTLAEQIVGEVDGAWLADLDTNALRELVSLSSDATLDDAD
jgi:SNF2 family DNA or RNA helicase